MDISSFASQNSKLLDAFEKMASSAGSELKSSGPMGEPSSELVQEFEAALQASSEEAGTQGQNTSDTSTLTIDEENLPPPNFSLEVHSLQDVQNVTGLDSTQVIQSVDNTSSINSIDNNTFAETDTGNFFLEKVDVNASTEKVQGANSEQNSSQKVSSEELDTREIMSELKDIMDKIGQGNMSSTDLFRAQYLTSLFSLNVTSGSKTTQQAAQGVESILKEQN